MPKSIVIDDREHSNHPGFAHALNRIGEVKVQRLDSADFVLPNGIGIERKTLSDLAGSLASRRFYDQLSVLCDTYEKPFVLIEGELTASSIYSRDSAARFSRLMGTQVSVLFSWSKPKMIYTHGERETSEFLKRAMSYTGVSGNLFVPPVVKKGKTPRQTYLNMLMCVSGIGAKGSRAIQTHAKTMRQLIEIVESCKPKDFHKKVKGVRLSAIKTLWKLLK
ncbi:MAG: ERCC4 domain-containing protein [Planctomycetota bacterium]|jgi:ERCC4-type nuclease